MYLWEFTEKCDSRQWLELGAYIPSFKEGKEENGIYGKTNDFWER